ncbi:hypothetical protein FIU57_14635, partial [Enterococcus faecium]
DVYKIQPHVGLFNSILQVDVKDGIIQNIAFDGSGCSISTASASMMTDACLLYKSEGADNLKRQDLSDHRACKAS